MHPPAQHHLLRLLPTRQGRRRKAAPERAELRSAPRSCRHQRSGPRPGPAGLTPPPPAHPRPSAAAIGRAVAKRRSTRARTAPAGRSGCCGTACGGTCPGRGEAEHVWHLSAGPESGDGQRAAPVEGKENQSVRLAAGKPCSAAPGGRR